VGATLGVFWPQSPSLTRLGFLRQEASPCERYDRGSRGAVPTAYAVGLAGLFAGVCGPGTFTRDLRTAVAAELPAAECLVIAMDDGTGPRQTRRKMPRRWSQRAVTSITAKVVRLPTQAQSGGSGPTSRWLTAPNAPMPAAR